MLERKTLPVLALALALSCAVYAAQPERLVGGADLGTTKAAHSLTRGHNRKIIYDTTYQHWYLFWLRDDGTPTFNPEEEGVVYQMSSDGLTWSRPVVMEPFQNGGITAWDVVWSGRSLCVLGLIDEYNLSVISPDKQQVAYCIGWHERAKDHSGYIEPVGTHAAYRQRGFAKAINKECFARMKANGIKTVEIASRAEPDVANFLYDALSPNTRREVHKYAKKVSFG